MPNARVHPDSNGDAYAVDDDPFVDSGSPDGNATDSCTARNPVAFGTARQLTTRLQGTVSSRSSSCGERSSMMARLSRLSSSASLMPRRLSNRWAAVRSVLAEQRRQAEEQRGTRRRLSTLKKLARVIATGESGELGGETWRMTGDAYVGPEGVDRLVIHPHSRVKGAFDFFVVVCVLWTIVMVPVQLTVLQDEEPDGFQTLERVLDAIFILDVVLQFFHGYMLHGFPVLKLERVARHYLQTWFVIDLLSSVPFSSLPITGPWAAFRLLKVMRLLRIRRLMQRWKAFAAAKVLHVFQTVLGWLIMAHWLACGWYFLGWNLRCTLDTSDTAGQTWVTVYWPALDTPCTVDWARVATDASAPGVPAPHTRWLRSLYWALATMTSLGYGAGPVAHTDAEFAYSVLCQVLGACCYAAIFGNIAQLIQKLDSAGLRYQAQLEKVNEFIRFHKLPSFLANKLHAYAEFQFAVNRGFKVSEIAEAMPLNLQEEVFLHLHEHLVRQVPMFENCDDGFIKALVQLLQPQVLLKGDYAFKVYELGGTMYFIQNGCVQIVSDGNPQVVYCTLMEGSYFGELAMLTSQRRTASALAHTDCILFFMTVDSFEEVIKDYPKYYDDILDKAMERLENTLRSNASMELRMQQLDIKADILRNKELKQLGTRRASQVRAALGDVGKKDSSSMSSQAKEVLRHSESNPSPEASAVATEARQQPRRRNSFSKLLEAAQREASPPSAPAKAKAAGKMLGGMKRQNTVWHLPTVSTPPALRTSKDSGGGDEAATADGKGGGQGGQGGEGGGGEGGGEGRSSPVISISAAGGAEGGEGPSPDTLRKSAAPRRKSRETCDGLGKIDESASCDTSSDGGSVSRQRRPRSRANSRELPLTTIDRGGMLLEAGGGGTPTGTPSRRRRSMSSDFLKAGSAEADDPRRRSFSGRASSELASSSESAQLRNSAPGDSLLPSEQRRRAEGGAGPSPAPRGSTAEQYIEEVASETVARKLSCSSYEGPGGTATHSFREAARERAGTSLAARLKRAADLARAEKGGAAAPPGPTMSTNWSSVLEAAVAQRRAKIANNGPRGAMALEVHPGGSGPSPVAAASPWRRAGGAGPLADCGAAASDAASGADVAALHALLQEMKQGVASIHTRLGAIEHRLDARGGGADGGGGRKPPDSD